MAKKTAKKDSQTTKPTGRQSSAATAKAKETGRKLENLADAVAKAAAKRTTPRMEIPIRALSNVKFNRKRAIIEMGQDVDTGVQATTDEEPEKPVLHLTRNGAPAPQYGQVKTQG